MMVSYPKRKFSPGNEVLSKNMIVYYLNLIINAENSEGRESSTPENWQKIVDIAQEVVNSFPAPAMDVDTILQERGGQYGDYGTVAERFVDLLDDCIDNNSSLRKHVALLYDRYAENKPPGGLTHAEVHSIFLICAKLARIKSPTASDEVRADQWIDIAGYAKLALQSRSR